MTIIAQEDLVDRYLSIVGISTVYVSLQGTINSEASVGVSHPNGSVVFCCKQGDELRLVDLARSLYSSEDHRKAVMAIRQAAAELSIGLTPHETVVTRARAAVSKVEQTMAEMQKTGALKAMNREFKAAREAGLATSYGAFVHGKKLALLEAMAAARR